MGQVLNYARLAALADAIRRHPGRRVADYARLLDTDNKTVTRALPQLEWLGVRLAEDPRRRLYYVDGLDRLSVRQRGD